MSLGIGYLTFIFEVCKKRLPHKRIVKSKRYWIKITPFEIPVGYIHIDDKEQFEKELDSFGVEKRERLRNQCLRTY